MNSEPRTLKCRYMKKDKGLSRKQKDLASLGVGSLYSGIYCFAFSSFGIFSGLVLCLASLRYSVFSAWLAFLLTGLILIALGLVSLGFGLMAIKLKKEPTREPLLCPITAWKVIRNGYVVSSILLGIGWTIMTVGVFQFPEVPVAGVSLFAVSLVVLLYGRLLLLATVRDHLIARFSK